MKLHKTLLINIVTNKIKKLQHKLNLRPESLLGVILKDTAFLHSSAGKQILYFIYHCVMIHMVLRYEVLDIRTNRMQETWLCVHVQCYHTLVSTILD